MIDYNDPNDPNYDSYWGDKETGHRGTTDCPEMISRHSLVLSKPCICSHSPKRSTQPSTGKPRLVMPNP